MKRKIDKFILHICLSSLLVVLYACKKVDISQEVISIQNTFIPDKRVDFFDAKLSQSDSGLILRGETNLPEAKVSLLSLLNEKDIKYRDSLIILPNSNFDRGVVNVSVAMIRGKARHAGELVTQAILGTPVVIFKKEKDWYYIQTPDRYLGWTNQESIKAMDQMSYENWEIIPKMIVTVDATESYSQPSLSASSVSDLVLSCVLQFRGKSGPFVKVGYPDGRNGYVPNGDVQFLDKWISNIEALPDNVMKSASNFLGRPYLWGGASPYGFDCSGFTKMVFFQNGILLPRDASQQVLVGKDIETDRSLNNCEKGDLLFFGKRGEEGEKDKVTHVAIYMGEGKIIHATGRVKIESLYADDDLYNKRHHNTLLSARRLIGHSKNLLTIGDVYGN